MLENGRLNGSTDQYDFCNKCSLPEIMSESSAKDSKHMID